MQRLSKKVWTIAAVVVAVTLFGLACSGSVYELTSPAFLSWHVILRKIYSLVAFAIVGYLFRRSGVENGGGESILRTIVATAAYSAAIEVGQYFSGSHEGFVWNVIDTICGAIGGAIAAADLIARGRRVRT